MASFMMMAATENSGSPRAAAAAGAASGDVTETPKAATKLHRQPTLEEEYDGLTMLTMTDTKKRDSVEPSYRDVDIPKLRFETSSRAASNSSSPRSSIVNSPMISPDMLRKKYGHRRQRSNSDAGIVFGNYDKYDKEDTTDTEVKQTLAYWELETETRTLQAKLLQKVEECANLEQYKEQLTAEMDDLTTSVFEEAHNMVHREKEARVAAEKKSKETDDRAGVLEAEVKALKTLVTSMKRDLQRKARKKSENDVGEQAHHEDDPLLYSEFCEWHMDPALSEKSDFFARALREDILPCLSFHNQQATAKHQPALVQSIQENTLCIMTKSAAEIESSAPTCELCAAERQCKFKFQTSEGGSWNQSCYSCRNRIVAVCEFYMYARHVTQGLVKATPEETYAKFGAMRLQVNQARLGLPLRN